MGIAKITIETKGERFYSITPQIKEICHDLAEGKSGIIYLYCLHTSAGLVITESFENSAVHDLENFLKKIAPRNASFITHTTEGEDDSPSHMKGLLLNTELFVFVEKGKMLLGEWQGIFLAEFRDSPKKRTVAVKFVADPS